MMEILYPMFVMAVLTFIVAPMLLLTRVSSVRNGVVKIEYYEIFKGGEPPRIVEQATRHWSNLYEAPMLFYIVCLVVLAIQIESALLVGLAWSYVAIRIAHTCIHLTYNKVYHRLTIFLISQFVLIAMWIVVFIKVI